MQLSEEARPGRDCDDEDNNKRNEGKGKLTEQREDIFGGLKGREKRIEERMQRKEPRTELFVYEKSEKEGGREKIGEEKERQKGKTRRGWKLVGGSFVVRV